MKTSSIFKILLVLSVFLPPFVLFHSASYAARTEPLIVDHTCTDINQTPEKDISVFF